MLGLGQLASDHGIEVLAIRCKDCGSQTTARNAQRIDSGRQMTAMGSHCINSGSHMTAGVCGA